MEFEKVSVKNMSDEVYEILKRKILRWELTEGQRLKDKEIAEGLGVSRSLVRNVFPVLEKEGLVKISRKGVYVAQFTKKEIQEIFEVRRLLESFALESAIGSITSEEIEKIDKKIQRAECALKDEKFEEALDLDFGLHELMIKKCNNSHINKIYSTYQNIIKIIAFSNFNNMEDILQAFKEHCRLIEAIKKRDLLKGKKALQAHLLSAMHRVLKNFAAIADTNAYSDTKAN